MFIGNTNTLFQKFFFLNNPPNFSPYFMENEFTNIQNPSNFYSQEEEINSLSDDTKSNSFFSFKLSLDSLLSSDEKEDCLIEPNHSSLFSLESIIEKEKEKKPIFKVVYPKKDSLFTNGENNSVLLIKEETGEIFLKRKRFPYRRPRKDNQDNIRKKIKLGFFNIALIKMLNDKLRSIGNNKYFSKFPQSFISDVNKKRNKEIFEKSLRDIFVEKELYKCEDKKGASNYFQNLNIVQNEKNVGFKKILDKKIKDLYEEYINSDEFKIREINRLKNKDMSDDYIARYIYLANHLCEFLYQ